MVNAYSPAWFDIFLKTIPPAQTAAEVAFLRRHLPLPDYARLLDVCCGPGRHALPLATHGYAVTGLDRNLDMLAQAAASVAWVAGGMGALPLADGYFDVVMCLWQSFGYFDAMTNEAALRQMAAKLRPGGLLLLDVYHRGFFAQPAQQGTRIWQRNGQAVTATQGLTGNHWQVRLAYADGGGDQFAWQLYEPDELCQLAARLGLTSLLVCANFEEGVPASPVFPRMQLLFTRD
ncbi:MAG: class I SAM-dependent methyltransferase [Candidatus Promineifilaceae bacterium]